MPLVMAILVTCHLNSSQFQDIMSLNCIYLGSEEKLAACKNLGADVCINYKTEDFVARVEEETGGKGISSVLQQLGLQCRYLTTESNYDAGVDVILDNVGGPYLQKNLDSLGMDGRLFIIGFMGGAVTEVNLSCLLARRLTVQGIASIFFSYSACA